MPTLPTAKRTMEGDPSIPVITDTWLKGLRDFDIETAYKAFRASATLPGKDNRMRPDIDDYIAKGYVPLGAFAQDNSGDNSVSHALEYYIADYALSNLATALGKKDDAALFYKRSLGYKHYYDKKFGTLRPRHADGSWLTPFDPKDGADFSNAPGFHEGSAWNYTFYVPHDVKGLARLMGGETAPAGGGRRRKVPAPAGCVPHRRRRDPRPGRFGGGKALWCTHPHFRHGEGRSPPHPGTGDAGWPGNRHW